ncbi:replication-relaxation family protein [Streptomyces mirabilis]|uniref:replication-relaxation family protein n=1 Tax=Streptomyces mirabilis TaxID=68239 RepID=UPI00381C0F9B
MSLRDRGQAFVVGVLVGASCCCDPYAVPDRPVPHRTGSERTVMIGVDAGNGDRLALAVLTQYRMATTEQMHRVIAPSVRIEQTRRRLARLREEGLVDRITLPQAGRTRVWFPTSYAVQLASEWPEMRGHRPSRTVSDPTAVRLKAGHTLTVTETALAFLEDARRRGDVCRPLDWLTEVHHSIGSGEAVIPEASCTTGAVPPTATTG